MHRVILLLVLVVPLAACSSSAKTATPPTVANGTPDSGSPTAPPTGPATLPTAANVSPVTISAFVLAVNLGAHTITVDPMAFLTGAAAKTAFEHDHPGAQEGPPNDYYISNPQKDRVDLVFPPSAKVRLVHVGGTDHTQPVAVPQSALVGYPTLARRPFVITASSGSVKTLVERFVP